MSGSQAGSICLWEVATGKKLRVVGNDDQWHAAVKAVAYSPDGQTLAAGGWEQTIHRWDVATGKLRRPFVAHEGPIFNVAFSADNRKLLTAGYDGEGHAWSLASGREVVSVWTGKPCRCRSFLASGRMMVTVQEGVQIRDFVSGKELARFPEGAKWDDSFALSADTRLLATGASDYKIRLWESASTKPRREFSADEIHYRFPRARAHGVSSLEFCLGDKTLISAGTGTTTFVTTV